MGMGTLESESDDVLQLDQCTMLCRSQLEF